MKLNNYTGTTTLVILALRRDRIRLVVWLLGIALLTGLMFAAISEMLPTTDDVTSMLTAHARNPAMRIFLGPAAGSSLGSFFMFRFSTAIAFIIAFFGTLTVTRHTRQNEETGCEELTGSTKVGRYAGLMAALMVTTGASILLMILIGIAFILNGLPAGSSFAAGAAMGAVGIAFAGIAAITAQLSDTNRGANGISGMIMAVTFFIGGLGNMLGEFEESTYELISSWPVWLSPFGWYQQVLAFSENNWWVLLLFLAFLLLTAKVGFMLNGRRDVGGGILPARKGPATAPASLLSPLGLAWRLQRKLFFVWAIAALLLGAALGAVVGELGDQMSGLERADQMFGDIFGMNETFVKALSALLGSFIIFYTTQAFMRMVSEEKDGLTEPVLSTAVTPAGWIMSHITCIGLGTSVVLLLLGVGSGVSAAIVETNFRWYKPVESAILQAPALLATVGFFIMVFGLAPRMSRTLSWAMLVASLLAGPFLGAGLNLPQWIQNISPFTHIPGPTETFKAVPIIVLLLIAVLLAAIGVVSFHYRRMRTYRNVSHSPEPL